MRDRELHGASASTGRTIAMCDRKIESSEEMIGALLRALRAGSLTQGQRANTATALRFHLEVRRAHRALRRASQRTQDMADGLIPMQSVFDPAEAVA